MKKKTFLAEMQKMSLIYVKNANQMNVIFI